MIYQYNFSLGHSQLKHRIKQSLRRARNSLELCERVIEATAYLDGRPLLEAVYTPPRFDDSGTHNFLDARGRSAPTYQPQISLYPEETSSQSSAALLLSSGSVQ